MNRRNLEFSCGVLLVGLLAGVAGAATTFLLHFVEHLTYHYSLGTLLDGVTGASRVRRAVGPMIGGALAGLGWWLLRRRARVPSLSTAITHHEPIPRLVMSLDAGLQVLLVGAGASLGREGAPRQFAAALGDLGTSRWALSAEDREILLGCAAGAGLAAVYSVPMGGALFALQIVLRTWKLRAVGTALITSALATAVAAPITHLEHVLQWPDANLSYLLTAFAILLSPLALGVGLAFNWMMDFARAHKVRDSWLLIPAIAMAGLAVGLLSHWWPELPGNGRSVLAVSISSGLTLASAVVICVLKPLLTALFLRAGAVGGMLTPALATGAAAGSVLALSINTWTPLHVSLPAVSLACAAGVLAVTQGAPLWAALFVTELARPPLWLLIVFLAAAMATHYLALACRGRRPACGPSRLRRAEQPGPEQRSPHRQAR
ncbi:chloride channel protein [Candidatus Mycolicibacterium alkanivorans]|uniref:Chloride channel protein n=1 Tax=Candidatus Mycolicibacterium alkanivorans TaxID=2954114 RepID=A0ABS9YUU1_9MYCO|nr:chloride channel protein [Candidatus Mycolicibacterium alkanivorans]MCI4674888.1 chloride channel protein [Candidatus Mycolicibacterium alkanivorans]